MPKVFRDLSDDAIDALIDFEMRGMFWDKKVQGLRLLIGKRKVTWQFYALTRDHGRRGCIFETLGHYDRGGFRTLVIVTGNEPRLHRDDWHMNTDAARKAALGIVGDRIRGRRPSNEALGLTFAEYWPTYIAHLQRKAADRGKSPRWARNVQQLGNQLLLPKWGSWSLAEMAQRPVLFKDWFLTIESKVSANHCRAIMRALYNAARRDYPQLPASNPMQSTLRRVQQTKQRGMTLKQLSSWFDAWGKIENPVRRAYHLTGLLTGCRPTELAAATWGCIDSADNMLVLGNLKAGNAVEIPITPEIAGALALAGKPGKPEALIFPGCGNIAGGKFRGELEFKGQALRRTFKTVADEIGIPDEISGYLMGHVPPNMSQAYIPRWARKEGANIRKCQQKISAAMMAALRSKPKRRKAA